MKIYIVEGSTGEYSDHVEWVVCAFKNKDNAQELVINASARAREIYSKYNTWDVGEREDLKSKYDPKMQMDYTGTNYRIIETELM